MAHSMIKWTFNAANAVNDVWWREMGISAQLLCEHYLQSCHHGDSKIYYYHKRVMYVVDLVKMTQQNLSTGKLRQIQRIEAPFVLPNRPLSSMGEIPEACHIAEYNFREIDPFKNVAEDDKWGQGVFETDQKQRKHRR